MRTVEIARLGWNNTIQPIPVRMGGVPKMAMRTDDGFVGVAMEVDDQMTFMMRKFTITATNSKPPAGFVWVGSVCMAGSNDPWHVWTTNPGATA